jgi:hypothetical protein
MQDELPQATVTRGKTQCGKHIVSLFDLHAGNTVQLVCRSNKDAYLLVQALMEHTSGIENFTQGDKFVPCPHCASPDACPDLGCMGWRSKETDGQNESYG